MSVPLIVLKFQTSSFILSFKKSLKTVKLTLSLPRHVNLPVEVIIPDMFDGSLKTISKFAKVPDSKTYYCIFQEPSHFKGKEVDKLMKMKAVEVQVTLLCPSFLPSFR